MNAEIPDDGLDYERLRQHVLAKATPQERRLELLRLNAVSWYGYGQPYHPFTLHMTREQFNALWNACEP